MIVHVEPSFALPLVSITVAFRAGSSSDPKGKEGLARVTARMLRRGSLGLSAHAIEESVDRLGGEFATDVGLSWLSLGMEVIERNLDPFIELMAGIVARPTFDEGELGKLLREAEGEIVESRDSDRTLAGRALRRTLFEGHPYARRSGGYIETLRGLTRADAEAFFGRHVCRANAVVAVSGHVSVERGRAIVDRLLSGLPEGEKSPDPVPEPEKPRGRTLVFVDKPERTQTQMYLATLGSRPVDPDHTPLHVATTILGGTFTARLMQKIRVERGWSYGTYARLGLERHREAFTASAAPGQADAAPCLALLLELVEAWQAGGVTQEELEFTRNYLARSHVFEIDTASKRAHQKVDEAIFDLPDGYHASYVERVRAVEKTGCDAAVSSRISTRDVVIAVVGTYKDIGKSIEAAIPDLAETRVVPFDLE